MREHTAYINDGRIQLYRGDNGRMYIVLEDNKGNRSGRIYMSAKKAATPRLIKMWEDNFENERS